MTKITIEVEEDDLSIGKMHTVLLTKVVKSYYEAKAKEIKIGDWFYMLASDKYDEIHRAKEINVKYGIGNGTKLPQNLQDGLNEFISKLKD